MTILKQIEQLERMDQLIRLESTGTLKEFANKLNVSESTIYKLLSLAKHLEVFIEFGHQPT